jgi:hypothetical protein
MDLHGLSGDALIALRDQISVILNDRLDEREAADFGDVLQNSFADEFKSLLARFKELKATAPVKVRREFKYDFTLSFDGEVLPLAMLMEQHQGLIMPRSFVANLKVEQIDDSDNDFYFSWIESADTEDCEDVLISFPEVKVIDRQFAERLETFAKDVQDFVTRVKKQLGTTDHVMFSDLFKNFE